jgi:chromosome segregation ATPase
MGIIDRLLGSKTAITSDMINAEIERAEGEILTLHSKLAAARSGIMLLSDAEHQPVEQSSAITKRAIDRLDMRIAHLQSELPAVLAAEEAAQAAATDEALRKRAEDFRKANAKESKVLLASYADHANAIAETVAKLKAITDETHSVNEALRLNPIADSVVHYDTHHRKHPDREATGSTSFRAGQYEDSLESAVRLPPAFVGTYIWPRS